MQAKKARRRALSGTLSTFFAEDEVAADCSHPKQRSIFVTHSKTFDLRPSPKPLPAAKADLGLLFNFHDGKKSSMYRRLRRAQSSRGYICGFSPS